MADQKKNPEMEEDVEIITLEFDEGEEVECEIMGVFDFNGKEYIALIPDDWCSRMMSTSMATKKSVRKNSKSWISRMMRNSKPLQLNSIKSWMNRNNCDSGRKTAARRSFFRDLG